MPNNQVPTQEDMNYFADLQLRSTFRSYVALRSKCKNDN